MRIVLLILLFATQAYGQTPMHRLLKKSGSTPPPASTAFLTSTPTSGTRNDYNGEVGMKFTVAGSNITVTDIGRWVISGNSGSHTVRIVDSATLTTVASVSVNTSGQPDGYLYVSITPVVLTANTPYYLLSTEVGGGDLWHEQETVTSTAAGVVNTSIVVLAGPNYFPVVPGYCYVPPNFKYY